jgi:hypothetical protein
MNPVLPMSLAEMPARRDAVRPISDDVKDLR